jgi:hypothetical protein
MKGRQSQYAPNAQVRRIAKLAVELGIAPAALRLGADGSVLVSAAPSSAMVTTDEPDEVLAAWEAERNLVRRS